jgi:DNA mismatch repair protein MutL
MAQHPIPVVTPPMNPTTWDRRQMLQGGGRGTPSQTQMALDIHRTADQAPLAGEAPRPATAPPPPFERLPMLRVLGQIAQTYIIAEGPGGMYLIDQHAAHERIRYEELQAQRARQAVAAQELLEPLPVELSPQQAILLEAHLDLLAAYGLEAIPFGGATLLVKRVPVSLVGRDVAAALIELVEAALQGGAGFAWEDQVLVTLACHTAVRAGQILSADEMRDLVRQLERAALPHTCPHGRPTMIHLSQAQLEKEFGRR